MSFDRVGLPPKSFDEKVGATSYNHARSVHLPLPGLMVGYSHAQSMLLPEPNPSESENKDVVFEALYYHKTETSVFGA